MSLYQCENCGCRENTACGYHMIFFAHLFDWTGKEDLKEKKLCSACAPEKYADGTPSEFGKWHGRFRRMFLPKGEFKTNRIGNLQHIRTGSNDVMKFEVNPDGTKKA